MTEFPTIAERWAVCRGQAGVNDTLPPRMIALATLMFYAGFAASMEAHLESAEFTDAEALQKLTAMSAEMTQFREVDAFAILEAANGPAH